MSSNKQAAEEPMEESFSDTEDDNSLDFDDIQEENLRLKDEYEKLREELLAETQKLEEEEALTMQLDANRKRLQEEIAELEVTRKKLLAEKTFWDWVSQNPNYDHWPDFFNKNRAPAM